jgi:hypothetical protein
VKARGLFASLFLEKPPTKDDSIRGSLLTLMKSDKFPWKLETSTGRIEMVWNNNFIVIYRESRSPLVIIESDGLRFTYEHDYELADAVREFANRADAARDRSKVVEAIHELLQ